MEKYFLVYYIHFEITDYPCNMIGYQQCDLFLNRTIFCPKSTPNRVIHVLNRIISVLNRTIFASFLFRIQNEM